MKVVKNIFYYKDMGTDSEGNKKSLPMRVGVILQNEKGHLRIKLDVIPTAFDGWLDAFDPKPAKKENPF